MLTMDERRVLWRLFAASPSQSFDKVIHANTVFPVFSFSLQHTDIPQ